ncbi:MAG: VCBS repeat-containing protein [Kiritimatiellae bacterium]|nr:VCBS repeat-containing protein [Kiritimatiellia bacterium]
MVIGLVLWVGTGVSSFVLAQEMISGWPKLDEHGIPMSWYAAAHKWIGPRVFGDLNGNGSEDVVVAKGPGIAVFQKDKDGKWTEIASYVHPTGTADVRSMAIGDTDGDGKKEIYLGTAQGGNPANACRVYIFEHAEGNNFSQVGVLGPYGRDGVRHLEIADVNADGKQEVIVTHARLRFYASKEDNIWEEVWKNAEDNDDGHYFNGAAVADLDNDNKPELYVGVEQYDSGVKKDHGWLYVYEMAGKNQYGKIWECDDMGAYVTDVRLLNEKETGKVFVAGQLKTSPSTWALFEPSGKKSYSFRGVKSQKDVDVLFEAQ